MADERMNKSLTRLFDIIDTDKTDGGVVTSAEMLRAFLKFATSAEAMDTLSNIAQYLMDADGIKMQQAAIEIGGVTALFIQILQTEGDGRCASDERQITKDNFVKKMGHFKDQWNLMDTMFKDIDTNDDETISAGEIEDHKLPTPQWLKEALDASEGGTLKRHEIFLSFILTTPINLPTGQQ